MENLDILFHYEILDCALIGINELLWVSVNDRKPGTLDLYHQTMSR